MSNRRRLGLCMAVTALGLLAVPGTALAQFFPLEEESGPGITVTGSGLAAVAASARLTERSIQRAVDAASPSAAERAMRDARRRGRQMADAAGLELGPITEIGLDDASPQFGLPRSHCRQSRRSTRPRCSVPAFTASTATVSFSIVDGAEGGDAAPTVEAYGSATAAVEPRNRRSNRSIRQAVVAARRTLIPAAAEAARRNAQTAARVAGLSLGGIVSISEEQQLYPYDVALGTFGPGQFCRVVRSAVFERDSESGRTRVVRRVRRRRCYVPPAVTLRVEAVYETR